MNTVMQSKGCFRLYTTEGTVDLPVNEWGDGRSFLASMPETSTNVTEVRLFSDALDRPVRFILENFAVDREAGLWTIRGSEDELGLEFHLEYCATYRYGKKVRIAVFQWSHERSQMEFC